MTTTSYDKVSHHLQLGGIETAVLDNGAARGTRVAWVNTGAGLRYKVVIDRAMDIADASVNRYNLAWLSHTGVTAPERFSIHGADWLRTFGGGLVTTCGLSHFGPPEKDEYGERGLHGLISNQPAILESVVQPDPARGRMEMSITGRIRETQIFGPSLELRRTISGVLGEPVIRIHDEVTNLGNTATPHMVLYHCNFGWPLIDRGADILWNGTWQSAGSENDNRIFREGNNFRKCPDVTDEHRGGGEAVAFIDPSTDAAGNVTCGVHNSQISVAVLIHFDKKQLPVLSNWQHWAQGEYVMGLEPGTNPPIGQAAARDQKKLIYLEPGETRSYDLALEVLTEKKNILDTLKKYNL